MELITAEGDEMKIAPELVSLQALRHAVDCRPSVVRHK